MIFFIYFYFYPYQLRSFHLIYLLLDRKRFVKSKEIWKPGTNPLLSVVKVVPARSVLGSGREGRWNLSPSSFFHLLVSLPNRTVERRGRQNAWVWQTWWGYYLCVLSGIYLHVTLLFLALLQKDLFKGMWSLAEGFFHENYCHACHTRFSAVFPLPSGCVSSLIGDFTNQNATQPETSPEVICTQSASLRMLGAKLQRVFFSLLHVQNTRLALAAFPENVSSFYWIWPRIKFSFATL